MNAELNIKLPRLELLKPTLVDSFIIVARDYLAGLKAIAESPTGNHLSANSLGGQCLECVLKAVFAQMGYTKKQLAAKDLGHNLIALWQSASGHLGLDPDPPTWVKTLNNGHGKQPYHFRYHEGIHGLAIVPATELLENISALCEQVKARIGISI